MPNDLLPDNQKKLLRLLQRRHPAYAENLPQWNFFEATYFGGRAWFDQHIFKYFREGADEFQDRISRAYRFNHTKEVVELMNKYIFKGSIVRNTEDAPEEITTFWKNVTLSGLDIKQFMTLVGRLSSIYGIIWIFTDTNKQPDDGLTVADEKSGKARAYAYTVKPQDILDMGFDDDGVLNWILVRETDREDDDPIESSGDTIEQFRLWTRTEWRLFRLNRGTKKNEITVQETGRGTNMLGRVPCFPVVHVLGEHRYAAPGLINDVAYLDRAVANYLSNLDAIIQDQTFSQLVIPAQGLSSDTDEYDKVLEMGTKRLFTFDGEAGQPEYISPDPKQAQLILAVVTKIVGEIYHSIGMAGERTKQDNAVGIDNSSGVAKAYDFDRVNSLLVSKAASLQIAENTLIELIADWTSTELEELPEDKHYVTYPENFDVRGLFDEFTVAEKLALIEAPDEVRREQMTQIISKLFPSLKTDLIKKMIESLESWPPKIDPMTGEPPSGFSNARRNPGTSKRQGQVTKKTP